MAEEEYVRVREEGFKSLVDMATPLSEPTPLYKHAPPSEPTPMTMQEFRPATVPSETTEAPMGMKLEEAVEKGRKYVEPVMGTIEKLKELRQKKLLREAMGEAEVEIVPKPKSLLEKMFPPKEKEHAFEEAGIEVR